MPRIFDPDATRVQSPPLPQADLETVLVAWHEATLRLEQTHSALQAEVRRLHEELEIKNRELARKNRLADLGQLATHIAHEVRNGLTPITLYLSLLRRRLQGDLGSLEVLGQVEAGFTSLDATVSDLLQFASDRPPQRSAVRIRSLVDDVFRGLAPQLAAQGIACQLDVPADLSWQADPVLLRRAVLNLVLNAVDAMPGGGELVVTAVESWRGLELEVADSGPGLPEAVRRRMFEPFFTTKSHGTGLGLAIVERVAAAHGGSIRAQNCPEGGAALTLCLPRCVQEAAA